MLLKSITTNKDLYTNSVYVTVSVSLLKCKLYMLKAPLLNSIHQIIEFVSWHMFQLSNDHLRKAYETLLWRCSFVDRNKSWSVSSTVWCLGINISTFIMCINHTKDSNYINIRTLKFNIPHLHRTLSGQKIRVRLWRKDDKVSF